MQGARIPRNSRAIFVSCLASNVEDLKRFVFWKDLPEVMFNAYPCPGIPRLDLDAKELALRPTLPSEPGLFPFARRRIGRSIEKDAIGV
jgi:hypothetical protein